MNRLVVYCLSAYAIWASPALADFGDVLCSWRAPGPLGYDLYCRGLAWDGKYIWCNSDHGGAGNTYLYRCISSTGSPVSSFRTYYEYNKVSGTTNYRKLRGIDIIELLVYYQYEQERYIYRLNFKGEILGSVKITSPPYVDGITDDGTDNWVLGFDSAYQPGVYKLNSTGSATSSFAIPDAQYGGIAIQGDFFWLSVDYRGQYPTRGAYKIRTGGSIAASFGGREQFGDLIFDCAYENNHLWIVTDNNIVRCVDVSNAPAVAPASLGKVRALFR